jgi:hypothetical protein
MALRTEKVTLSLPNQRHMETKDKLLFMAEIKKTVINYLREQLTINTNALKAYDNDNPLQEKDPEINRMREIEAIKLRDRIYELTRHIDVIDRMIPSNAKNG